METLPLLEDYFTATSCYSSDIDDYLVENARCLRDFGPFKAGELLPVLCMDYVKGKLIEYDEHGAEMRSVNLKLEIA